MGGPLGVMLRAHSGLRASRCAGINLYGDSILYDLVDILEARRTVALTAKQEELSNQNRWDFSDLTALFINCTLKRSPELSNTEGLAKISMEIMNRQGVSVEMIRA